jgi:hypothetical protein
MLFANQSIKFQMRPTVEKLNEQAFNYVNLLIILLCKILVEAIKILS